MVSSATPVRPIESNKEPRRRGAVMKFFSDFRALFIKAFLLAWRKPGQTIAEILSAYIFMGVVLGMRYILDRRYYAAYQIPAANPQEYLSVNGTGNVIYYYPANTCAQTIVTTAVNDLTARWPLFPNTIQVMTDPTLASASNSTLLSIFAFVYFTNLDACTSASTMPDQVYYTLRLQENGPFYYQPQIVKISPNDYLWKRAPEDFCQSNSTIANYTNRFVGIQYAVDMGIVKYASGLSSNLSGDLVLSHFGCPEYYQDQFHSTYVFFVPVLLSVIFLITFIMTVGYIVEERQNKTKEFLRIYGLRTWINNLVWVTRSMVIYFVLVGFVTGLCMLVMPSSGSKSNSVSKAMFNYTNWTVVWTILFVYSIQVSTFTVLFGQFFKHPLLAKLLGFVLWVITFIDFYPGVPVGVRYFMCIFPNTGLLFCLQVVLQYERKSSGMVTYGQLYSNLFPYQLYIGLCLMMMLIYSVIYLFLAIYVERVNPGEFGISQPWYYLCRKSYWKPRATAVVEPTGDSRQGKVNDRWIEMTRASSFRAKSASSYSTQHPPSLSMSHLTKKFGKFTAVSDLSLNFYRGEVCSLLGHNGAGKTTTTFILVGMLDATSGVVNVEGYDTRLNIEKVRKILGFCPQYDILYDELSVEEHLLLVGRLRHIEAKELETSVGEILNLIGLVNDRQTLSKKLSGGMKRRLSIGMSMIGDPKVVILDEPTSGIDPYNRRLIWTIIRKMKDAGKCIILTTHFLEEADVLSDRIAIMTSGHLQAYGTPDYLKHQIEFEYRLFVDKKESSENERVLAFIQAHLPDVVLERQSTSEMVFGIRRNQSKQIGSLIQALDSQSESVGIDNYGLSMTTIEEVFLKLIQEEEQREDNYEEKVKHRQELANHVFREKHERVNGMKGFWLQIVALLVKRLHYSRREYIFLFGFFLAPLIFEIIIVSAIPTPQQIQVSITGIQRIKDASVTLLPSIYNPQTIVAYANSNVNSAQTQLLSYLESSGATIDQISTDTVMSYVQARYLSSEDVFINKYQMGFSIYPTSSGSSQSMIINTYFSTVNYHTMATSLSVGSTNLFQFYTNSSAKKIITTNQPVLTTSSAFSVLAQFFQVIYCFDTLPFSLFNFLNSVLAGLFMSILLMPIIKERVGQSKDLQLLTNINKISYWCANTIFDFCCCLIICVVLTIIIKIGAVAATNADAEVYIYRNNEPMGYFFLMILMYCFASIPFVYVFSFAPKTELIGFIVFFVVNLIVCFCDVIFSFITLFSQAQSSSSGSTGLSRIMTALSWILKFIFPTVNFKHALYFIHLRSSQECISASNSLLYTSYSSTEPWMSTTDPGLGISMIFFVVQIIIWWLLLSLVENRVRIRLRYRRYCKCDKDLELAARDNVSQRTTISSSHRQGSAWDGDYNIVSTSPNGWDDSQLDNDVRSERRLILQENPATTSAFVLVRDLVQRFKKRKEKTLRNQIYTAVDHLNFRITKQTCFGLLGANGAGKTTTFRMLINDLKPTSGEIIINRRDIYRQRRDVEIGFCPQFDWLLPNLSVVETLTLFARLKGLKWSIISALVEDMIVLFGLDMYHNRSVQKLSGGNKRKVSAALAFMANPSLVFLDEPTTGLDAAAKRKLWNVIRAARDIGMTIVMTSHSMEECEALCNKIGIMKLGQFVCLGNLQRLKNRFGNGYIVQVKLAPRDVDRFKAELFSNVPGVQILEEHNGMVYCSIPYKPVDPSERKKSGRAINLALIFEWFSKKSEERLFESYSITQTTLEQIFVQVTGDDQDVTESEPSIV